MTQFCTKVHKSGSVPKASFRNPEKGESVSSTTYQRHLISREKDLCCQDCNYIIMIYIYIYTDVRHIC